MSSEIEKLKKKHAELEADFKKHVGEARREDRKILDDLDARLKALEEKVKKKL